MEGEKSERVPSGGSSTSTTPMCIGVVGVSSERKAASMPTSDCMSAPFLASPRSPVMYPCARSRRSPVATPPGPPPDQCEGGLFHPHDDQLGDPVAPADGVVLLGIVVDQMTWSSPRYPASMRPGVFRTGHAVAGGQAAPGAR